MANNTVNKQQLTKRFNSNEFRELMPYLQLEELLLTDFKKGDSWSHLTSLTYKNKKIQTITCNVCETHTTCDQFKNHLKTLAHHDALLNVDQFYHPVYTFTKDTEKLAKGESVPEAELNDALVKASLALVRTSIVRFVLVRSIAERIQNVEESIYKDILNFALTRNTESVYEMFVRVNLPMEDIKHLEFNIGDGKWQQMLTTDSCLHKNSIYFCNLCSKICDGLAGVNQHFNNFNHKKLQLGTSEVRVTNHREVTRNCTFHFVPGNQFALKTRNENYDQLKELLKSSKQQQTTAAVADIEPEDKNKKIDDLPEVKKEIIFAPTPKQIPTKISAQVKLLKAKMPKLPDVKNYSDIDNHGLIGVEYVLKMTKITGNGKPVYNCVLCDKTYTELEMQQHLVGYKHRLLYLEKHYPKCIEKLNSCIGQRDDWELGKIYPPILAKIALAIEKHHGCSLPYVVSATAFEKNKKEITETVSGLPHANETSGPTFIDTVSVAAINEFIEIKDSYKWHTFDNTLPAKFSFAPPEGKVYLKKREYNMPKLSKPKLVQATPPQRQTQTQPQAKMQAAQRQPQPQAQTVRPSQPEAQTVRQSQPQTQNKTQPQTKSQSQLQTQRQPQPQTQTVRQSQPQNKTQSQHSSQIKIEPQRQTLNASDNFRKRSFGSLNDVWAKYNEEVANATSKLEFMYRNYEMNPESHPLFQQEWYRFRDNRKQELQNQGIDYRFHNCQAEWLNCFRGRLVQLFENELFEIKINYRNSLNIPLDAVEGDTSQRNSLNAGQTIERKNEPAFKKIKKETDRAGIDSTYTPLNNNSNNNNNNNITRKRITNDNLNRNQSTASATDEKQNVIHVLRLLTALEDYLGSFGIKITNLLSSALSLERSCYDNPKLLEQNILTEDNCSLLETAMEKLKGVLYAGLVDDYKVQGFKKVILSTTALLEYAQKLRLADNQAQYSKQHSGNLLDKTFKNELPRSDAIQNQMSWQSSGDSFQAFNSSNSVSMLNQSQQQGSSGFNRNNSYFNNNQQQQGSAGFNSNSSFSNNNNQQQRGSSGFNSNSSFSNNNNQQQQGLSGFNRNSSFSNNTNHQQQQQGSGFNRNSSFSNNTNNTNNQQQQGSSGFNSNSSFSNNTNQQQQGSSAFNRNNSNYQRQYQSSGNASDFNRSNSNSNSNNNTNQRFDLNVSNMSNSNNSVQRNNSGYDNFNRNDFNGDGRNNFNNKNNNYKANTGNYNISSNNGRAAFGNDMVETNMRKSSNFNENSLGNGNTSGNWGRFHNNEQWSSSNVQQPQQQQQPQLYQNNRGGRNY